MKQPQNQDFVFYQVNLTEREVESVGFNRESKAKAAKVGLFTLLMVVGGAVLIEFLERSGIVGIWTARGIGLIFMLGGFFYFMRMNYLWYKAGKTFLKTIQGR